VRIIKSRLSTSIASGVVEGDAVGWHPKIIWKGMASPNEKASRVDAIAVASPKIKLVAPKIYSQKTNMILGGV
jgi:hypothetical protein